MNNRFYSKILLFGEYSIIKGGNGLALPYQKYHGELTFQEDVKESTRLLNLNDFLNYLKNSFYLSQQIDLNLLEQDINKGLFFDSDIPQGYGVGSSGALCAAIFSKYSNLIKRSDEVNDKKIKYLQDIMALMESYYHGTSSGLDPLISYINEPVLMLGNKEKNVVKNFPREILSSFFLIDSGSSRQTSPFVHIFLKLLEEKTITQEMLDEYIQVNNLAIDAFLNKDLEVLEQKLYEISKFQYVHMSKMIPNNLKNLWFEGLESKKYFLKLCGAGGGGFIIGYTKDKKINFDDSFYLS